MSALSFMSRGLNARAEAAAQSLDIKDAESDLATALDRRGLLYARHNVRTGLLLRVESHLASHVVLTLVDVNAAGETKHVDLVRLGYHAAIAAATRVDGLEADEDGYTWASDAWAVVIGGVA